MIKERLDELGIRGETEPPRVVVARGDTAVGEQIQTGLAAADLPVDAATDGITAALDDAPADVVVCPHDPPEVDAFDLLADVGEAAPETPAVVAPASDDPGVTAGALDAGAADCATVDDGGVAVLARRIARVADRDFGVAPPDVRAAGGGGIRERVTDIVAAFNEVTGELNEARTLDEVAQVTATAANEVLDFPGTSARFYNEADHTLEVASMGAKVDEIDTRPPYPVDDSPHGEAFRRGETVIDDIGEDDPYDREVFNQTMYVPIGRYGTLSTGIETGEFSELDVLLTEMLAKNARNAFDQAERERQLAETALRVGEFADRVADAGASVTAAAEQVRGASQEVTESIDEIASGAAEQTDDLQAVLDELDDLLVTVDETVATADEVARQSQEAAELARRGSDRADAGMGEMRRIEDRTEAMLGDIRDLGEEIERVSEIAGLIEGVAEQTNILALNASIEAARAGEAGEGFAVVADEIKALAEETRSSTDEIAEIIETVTERTDRTVGEMEDMQADIEESVGTVAEALNALERIGEQVDETNESIQEISQVVAEQSTTLDETVSVAERVGAISEEVSGQTSSVAELIREQTTALEHVTDDAQELERMAGDLGEMTTEFSIDETVAENVDVAAGVAAGGAAGPAREADAAAADDGAAAEETDEIATPDVTDD